MRLREGGLGPRTHGALNGGSELCPGIRVWLAETALLGWAGLMDAQRETTLPAGSGWRSEGRQHLTTAESSVKLLAVARETAGGLKPGSEPLGMT